MRWFVLKYWVGNSEQTYLVLSSSHYEVMRKFTEWMPVDVTPWKIQIENATHADWLDEKAVN